MTRYFVDWNADGSLVIEAESQDDAQDRAYDMVRDYVDAHALNGSISVYVEEEE